MINFIGLSKIVSNGSIQKTIKRTIDSKFWGKYQYLNNEPNDPVFYIFYYTNYNIRMGCQYCV